MSKNSLNDLLVKKLFSTNVDKVLEALDEIENTGNSLYLPSLIELLYLQNSEDVYHRTLKLLTEIKHPDAVPELIKAIQNPRYGKQRENILNCCWQNGLDYSGYLSEIAEFVLDADYMVAFEAYTIIMNTEEKIANEKGNQIIVQLEASMNLQDAARQELIKDIIAYLPTIMH